MHMRWMAIVIFLHLKLEGVAAAQCRHGTAGIMGYTYARRKSGSKEGNSHNITTTPKSETERDRVLGREQQAALTAVG